MRTEQCEYFNSQACRSCTLLSVDDSEQVKFTALQRTLEDAYPGLIIEPMYSPRPKMRSRAKAKMVVAGSSAKPIVGYVDSLGSVTDIRSCPLHFELIEKIIHDVTNCIREFDIDPYDIKNRTGELKAVIISCNQSENAALVRFVLRSLNLEQNIRAASLKLSKLSPQIAVQSINIQPLPAAILEGEEEICITEQELLWEKYNTTHVAFSPQAFMQVTPVTAQMLYGTAREWLSGCNIKNLLDLYCGAGGFSLSLAPVVGQVRGVEIRQDAVRAAQVACERNGLRNVGFEALNVEESTRSLSLIDDVDCVVVNPPRRGLHVELKESLLQARPEYVLYSSCNVTTWMRDLGELLAGYELVRVKPFDMFVFTEHLEVLSLLRRRA